MAIKQDRFKRTGQSMPRFVREARNARGLMPACLAPPACRQNAYPGRSERAKRQAAKAG